MKEERRKEPTVLRFVYHPLQSVLQAVSRSSELPSMVDVIADVM
jgi:hypothetical protein